MSINFNGKTYNSLDEMPPDERRQFEQEMERIKKVFADQDQNGIPDMMEQGPIGAFLKATGEGERIGDTMRGAFSDDNANGVPDIMESGGKKSFAFASSQRFKINGVEYNSLDEMPPDVRAIYDRAMKGPLTTPGNTNRQEPVQSVPLISQPASFSYNTIEPEEGSNAGKILLVAILLGLIGFSCAAVYFFLR
jgi:hypothetical protein